MCLLSDADYESAHIESLTFYLTEKDPNMLVFLLYNSITYLTMRKFQEQGSFLPFLQAQDKIKHTINLPGQEKSDESKKISVKCIKYAEVMVLSLRSGVIFGLTTETEKNLFGIW